LEKVYITPNACVSFLNFRTEIEADHIGVMLLAAAGFDPRIAHGVYRKLGEILGDSA
jgi:predicted Zn-dependent protease